MSRDTLRHGLREHADSRTNTACSSRSTADVMERDGARKMGDTILKMRKLPPLDTIFNFETSLGVDDTAILSTHGVPMPRTIPTFIRAAREALRPRQGNVDLPGAHRGTCAKEGVYEAIREEGIEEIGELIAIHVGEAGITLGNAAWELYCIEHGIRPDGILCSEQDSSSLNAFFTMTSAGKCIPRAILVDTDSSILDNVRTGALRYLYNPKQLISGKEDAANCFAKGYMTIGREMMDALLERVRVSTEECSRFQGFIIYRAVGGGTGSGLACYLLEQIADDYKKPSRIEISIYPSPKLSSIVVEPYNALFATHLGMGTIDCSLVLDNDAVYDICDRELGISSPTFRNVNRVVAQVISTITAQFRFEGNPSVNLMELQTNLVPFPRIHFPLISYSPFARPSRVHQENYTVSSITNACFEDCNQMVKCNSRDGKYISCCLLYRGDVPAAEIDATLASIKTKKSVNFVSWLPTKFKIGVNFMPPITVPGGEIAAVNRACAMIANNTAIKTAWKKMNRKFDMMYNKKAFIHWYMTEGLEESDFLDTRMDMEALVSDYKEVESET